MELDLSQALGAKKARKPREARREHDAYMTPEPLVSAIVGRIAVYVPDPKVIVEPSCGDGEFVAAARKVWPNATTVGVDIRPEVGEKIKALGATFVPYDFPKTPYMPGADLFLGNPPYSLYVEFLDHILRGAHDGATLAFLLRLNMIVGGGETPVLDQPSTQAWWTAPLVGALSPNRQIIDVLPIFPRPSFTGRGTDATEYGLFILRKGFDNGGRFDPIRWNKPAPRRGRPKRGETLQSVAANIDFFSTLGG